MSPDALYALYYGGESGSRTEHLAGAALRMEHDWRHSGRLTVAFSRQHRAADTTERFIAANATKPSDRWVGNPDLAAETHWQAEISVEDRQVDGLRWRAEAWIDRVQDYILRDRARGQDGIIRTDHATVYHNGQAMLAGAGGSLTAPLSGWLTIQGNADWTFGQDLDEDVPLGQIPPLSGSTGIKAHHERIAGILTLRWAALATRVSDDPTTGASLDVGRTPAWAVLDWSLSWQPLASTEISLGVDNLLNQTYAEHLNKPSLFDTTAERVNEPGRSLWASASITF
jgi:iron complex outermembrane receptor protein